MVNDFVPYLSTNSSASPSVSCVPSPITRRTSAFCRANCSTPGASARQYGQCGAQNQTRTGLSAGKKFASCTHSFWPTSHTVTAGRNSVDTAFATGRFGRAPGFTEASRDPPQAAAITAAARAKAARRERCRLDMAGKPGEVNPTFPPAGTLRRRCRRLGRVQRNASSPGALDDCGELCGHLIAELRRSPEVDDGAGHGFGGVEQAAVGGGGD